MGTSANSSNHKVELALTLEPAVLTGEDGDELCGKKSLEVGEQTGMIVASHGAS